MFENATSGVPEATVKPKMDVMESTRASIDAILAKAEAEKQSEAAARRQVSAEEVEFKFETVFAPSYKSVPLLASMRQMRDKKYFGEGKTSQTTLSSSTSSTISGVSDSLTATMARQNSATASSFAKPFHGHGVIPEEMRLNSRDLVKEHVRYYMNEQRNVFGELTLMPSALIFEPALDDPVTRQLGLLNCQFQCELKDVLDVQVIEASEMLGWWRNKNNTNNSSSSNNGIAHNMANSALRNAENASSASDNSPYGGAPGSSSSSSSQPSAPGGSHRPRTHSLTHGPSSSHLNTGGSGMTVDQSKKHVVPHFAANVNVSPAPSPNKQLMEARLDRMDDDGLDKSLRFLQLTVLMPVQSSGTRGANRMVEKSSEGERMGGGGDKGDGESKEGREGAERISNSSSSVGSSAGSQGVTLSGREGSGREGSGGTGGSGNQVGKIVYFLINRQSVDLFQQKLEIWCAQARPVSISSTGRKPANNILKPQPSIYERMAAGADATSSLPLPNHKSSSPAPYASPQQPKTSSTSSQSHTSPSTSSSASTVHELEVPKLNLPSALLSSDTSLFKLAAALPTRYRHSDWTLLYSTERHGVSLMTFFNRTKRKGPSYLVIEDDAGFCFGAFISDSWEPQRSYYGTGECFLFTLYPSFNIYPWSQLNEYFIYSKEDTIALGGGSGKFALWLDQDLMRGSSAPCDTFLNSTLSYQEDFKPVIVEVWGFNDAMKN